MQQSRLNTAPSILLVIAGTGLALIPSLPRIELAPDLVLLGILPPLIYSAGVAMSWRQFRFNLRPITLLVFGCVIFTTTTVAAAAYWLLAMPLSVGFVLGAIVAPPDVVAPLARRCRYQRGGRVICVPRQRFLRPFAGVCCGFGVSLRTHAAGQPEYQCRDVVDTAYYTIEKDGHQVVATVASGEIAPRPLYRHVAFRSEGGFVGAACCRSERPDRRDERIEGRVFVRWSS